MKNSTPRLERLVAVVLAFGMFPSFTALSQQLVHTIPQLSRFLGPLNPLKIFAPVLFYFIWQQRNNLLPRTKSILLFIGILFTICTLVAAANCGFPPDFIREYAVMVLGVTASIALILLPPRMIAAVLLAWTTIVFSGVLLNLLAPEALTFINRTFFDPKRVAEIIDSKPVLIGYYDTASLGKLVVWIPWLSFWGFANSQAVKKRSDLLFPAFLAICSVISLSTTQRGPFLGVITGWIAFALHRFFRVRQARIAIISLTFLVIVAILVPILVPTSVIKNRIIPLFTQSFSSNPATDEKAHASIHQRHLIWNLAAKTAWEHPLGHPCIPEEEIRKLGIYEASHSHNIFLEQFKSRGWLWGFVHLALWVYALTVSWKKRDAASSFLLGGIVTTMTLGMVDHPWFVLNHAMIMGFFLFAGIQATRKQSMV